MVEEANAIGTTYLRAQTLAEPIRSRSLDLLVRYTDTSIPWRGASPTLLRAARPADGALIQRELWSLAGQTLDAAPVASAPRLYVDSLNTMIDSQTTRASALANRVPTAVLILEVVGVALALA